MSEKESPSSTRLDVRSLRALAHPLRLRLLDMLREGGPATASGLAQRVGESSGTTSWHLRQLAEHGLVEEETGRGNKRERWWRAVHDTHEMRTADFVDDPELSGPLSVYLHSVVQERYAAEAQFVSELGIWHENWSGSGGATLSDFPLSLTPAETAELNDAVHALIERYRREPRDGDTPVRAHWGAFPRRTHPERPPGQQP